MRGIKVDYIEEIERCASDAIKKPEDFGYWGKEEMFDTWGFCGIDKSNASGVLELSNFNVISKDLMSKFPNDFEIEGYSHWLVGHIDRLTCRVYEVIDGEKKITEAFYAAMEWQNFLQDYPVASDIDYESAVYVEIIELIKFWAEINKNLINVDLNPFWAEDVYTILCEQNYDLNPDIVGSPTDDDMMGAIYQLKLWNAEGYEEWFKWCDENNQERPPFDTESIARWNPDQLSLFDENGENNAK